MSGGVALGGGLPNGIIFAYARTVPNYGTIFAYARTVPKPYDINKHKWAYAYFGTFGNNCAITGVRPFCRINCDRYKVVNAPLQAYACFVVLTAIGIKRQL